VFATPCTVYQLKPSLSDDDQSSVFELKTLLKYSELQKIVNGFKQTNKPSSSPLFNVTVIPENETFMSSTFKNMKNFSNLNKISVLSLDLCPGDLGDDALVMTFAEEINPRSSGVVSATSMINSNSTHHFPSDNVEFRYYLVFIPSVSACLDSDESKKSYSVRSLEFQPGFVKYIERKSQDSTAADIFISSADSGTIYYVPLSDLRTSQPSKFLNVFVQGLPSPVVAFHYYSFQPNASEGKEDDSSFHCFAIGCEDGFLKCIFESVNSLDTIFHSCNVPSLITEVQFFGPDSKDQTPHLLICTSLGKAYISKDVFRIGVKHEDMLLLPESDLHDSSQASAVINSDSSIFVVVGTFDQMLLTYSWIEGQVECARAMNAGGSVLNLISFDFFEEGCDALIVQTLKGVAVLRSDYEKIASRRGLL
jgi:hypothetical protein